MAEAGNMPGAPVAGPSVRSDALGVQGTKIGRAIKSFDDACVHFHSCIVQIKMLIITTDVGWTSKTSACQSSILTLPR
jgi:hypothetical protein